GHRAPQVEVRIMFPCEAGRPENLNTVFGVVHRGIKRDGTRGGLGERAVVGINRRGVPREHAGLFSTTQHFGAEVLNRLEAADLVAELLAQIGLRRRNVMAPARDARAHGDDPGHMEAFDRARRAADLADDGNVAAHDPPHRCREIDSG
ncbi:MAG: hypothetical protein QOJ20_3029, partial [Mycobacterium sp.]|nr:hypothetical protein [Mycobacterium sp.]